jgi:hypothetical protein
MRVHVPVDLISCGVKEEFLYNQKKGHGNFIKGKIFSVSSYKNHALTFQVLLENGGVFSYIPIQAIVDIEKYKPDTEPLTPKDLLYHDCHDDEICIHDYPALQGPVQIYFRKKQAWLEGQYLFTIDWYRGNELLHMLKVENGQFCALPSHKVLFGEKERVLPLYEKMKQIWSVEAEDPEKK